MSIFRHTPDNIIFFDNDYMPLSFFLTQEPAYTLPVGMIEQRYNQGISYIASNGTTEQYYTIPNITLDGYITNKATYIAAYAAYLAAQALPQTLADAKIYQKQLMRIYAEILQKNGVTFEGITYQSSMEYYGRWKNEHDYALRNSILLTSYYLNDISNYEIIIPDVATLTDIIDDMDEFYWELQQVIDNHDDAIDALGTIPAVLAYDYTTGWPVTPYDAGLTFYASYVSSINADYAGGSATGTATGSAVISGGYLDCAHNDIGYVSHDGTSNVDSPQTGSLIFTVKPNYSGAPASDQVFFSIAKADADSTNLIQLTHKNTTGNLQLDIKDSSNVLIVSINFGAWTPVSGTDYKLSIHYNITSGDTWLKINDVQKGSVDTSTGTRDINIDLLRIGCGYNSGSPETSNFKIKLLYISTN